MLVDERAQLHDQIGPERRKDMQGLSRKPWEEAIAYQTVSKVSGQKAEGFPKLAEPKALFEGDPSRSKRAMGMHNTFGSACGA